MIDMDDPEHARRRKLVSSGFTPRRVRESEDKVRRVCDAIIDDVCERGECDLVSEIAAPLPMHMIGDMLGFAQDDHENLLRWSDDLLGALDGKPGAQERATDVFVQFIEYLTDVITHRRTTETRDDLIGTLVRAIVDDGRLDDEELIFESLLILIGGDETTRHVLTGGAYQLLADPALRDALVDEPTGIPLAVEEMLCWVSPIKNMARTVTRDTELRGRELAEGDKLILLYPSANRDVEVFDDPFRFDIFRSPNDHVAFGFGPHFCMGASFAHIELRVMFEQLLERLPDLRLVDPGEPAYRVSNFISGYESMPVEFTPTKPLVASV